jgi:signal transduction histidine kinase
MKRDVKVLFAKSDVIGGIFLFLCFLCFDRVQAAESYKVLILNSYHEGYFWTDGLVRGVVSTFKNEKIKAEFFIEYMDTRRYSPDALFTDLQRLYETKYAAMKFDLIVTTDNNALEFVRRCRKTLFPDVPIVFCGLDLTGKAMLEGLEPITGVVEDMGETSTLDVALELHPSANQLVIVNDKVFNPISNLPAFVEKFRHYKKVILIEITDYTYEQFLERIKAFGRESIVLLPTRFSDSEGREYTEEEVASVMQSCKAPIYTNNFLLMGAGPVGGCMNVPAHHGQIAGEMAIKILNGVKAGSIPIMHAGPKDFIFDYNQLERFGISNSQLPANSTVINEPKSFYREYKKQVWFISGVFSILSVLVLLLSTDIIKRRRVERKLLDYQGQLKSLASELTLTEERERRRIAMDIHDRISQGLVISKMKLERLRESEASDHVAGELDEVCNLLGQSIDSGRLLTFDLGSPILYELGFEAAVAEWLMEQGRKHNIETEFEDDEEPKPLDVDVRGVLFRMVRELLFNVVKHAHAKKVKVSVLRDDTFLKVLVADNGNGFEPNRIVRGGRQTGGFGLFSIRERLEQLGGKLDIESAPGHGCTAIITVPLKRENGEETEK